MIREAQPADGKKLARIQVDTWKSTYCGLLPPEIIDRLSYRQSENKWEQVFRERDKSSQSYAFVAAEKDGPVGYVVGGPTRDAGMDYGGEIYAIYVLESFQGRGLGALLLKTAVQRMIETELDSMVIWVLKGNEGAAGFYERHDGKRIAERIIGLAGFECRVIAYGWSDLKSSFAGCI